MFFFVNGFWVVPTFFETFIYKTTIGPHLPIQAISFHAQQPSGPLSSQISQAQPSTGSKEFALEYALMAQVGFVENSTEISPWLCFLCEGWLVGLANFVVASMICFFFLWGGGGGFGAGLCICLGLKIYF